LLAAAALLGTPLHHLIALAQALASLRARAADVCADAAGELVTVRTSKHEIGAGPTDVGTVEQQPDVSRIGVFATQLEAVAHGGKTDVVALGTLLDTLLHLSGDTGGKLMCHDCAPFVGDVRDLPDALM
jgi:hypothetical protein